MIPGTLNLIYQGKILKDDETLGGCGVTEGTFMVPMIDNGKYKKAKAAQEGEAPAAAKAQEVTPVPTAPAAKTPAAPTKAEEVAKDEGGKEEGSSGGKSGSGGPAEAEAEAATRGQMWRQMRHQSWRRGTR